MDFRRLESRLYGKCASFEFKFASTNSHVHNFVYTVGAISNPGEVEISFSQPIEAIKSAQDTPVQLKCGAVRCGAVRCGAVRCGAARRGTAR